MSAPVQQQNYKCPTCQHEEESQEGMEMHTDFSHGERIEGYSVFSLRDLKDMAKQIRAWDRKQMGATGKIPLAATGVFVTTTRKIKGKWQTQVGEMA